MCVAVPGEVIEVNDGKATVNFHGNEVTAYIGLVDVKPGDFVLVHAGCVIQKMQKREAEEMIELMDLMDETISENG